MSELPRIGNFHILVTALLLTLPHFDPLLSCEMLAQFREDILIESKTIEQRTILQRVENYVIVWAASRLAIAQFSE